jgi:23S rRNA-/tRNA-specific pseudouridylate synthase
MAEVYIQNGFRKITPYYLPIQTRAKGRWIGKTLLHVFTTEFHERPPIYYKNLIMDGQLLVNGLAVGIDYVLRNGDLIEQHVHRHEPPVSHLEIEIVFENSQMLVVNKPPSIPVGFYNKGSPNWQI